MVNEKPLIEVDYGLASSYDEGIEINRKLSGKLKDSIIKHERMHRNGKYTKKDFLTDFQAKNSNFKDSVLFCVKNPEAWIGFFPFMYSYYFKSFTYNSSALIPFLYFGLLFSGFWWILFKISFLNTFICYSGIILLINTYLLIYTHFCWKNTQK